MKSYRRYADITEMRTNESSGPTHRTISWLVGMGAQKNTWAGPQTEMRQHVANSGDGREDLGYGPESAAERLQEEANANAKLGYASNTTYSL
ncbi:hypothetical protein CONPUDRAFT_81010, partial [Coniophora puteana RWD-64-598 SS2]